MKTRPYLLLVLCLLINEITSFAQNSVPPISGWDMDEKSGSYILKPGKTTGTEPKEFVYEIMPVTKGEGQSIEDWFSGAIDKDIQQSGFALPAGTGKKSITTNQTIISFSTELTDKKGKAWYVTYVGYQVTGSENRMARVMSSPDVKHYATYMRPAADHFGQLAKLDASAAAAGKLTVKATPTHTRQETKAHAPTQSEHIPEKGLHSHEINGILIHLEYNTTPDGKMVRVYKPYLVLNDGSIYSEPVVSPYSLDVAASKLKEPKRWGTWKLKNNSFMVEWSARNETEKWFKNWFWATPSQKEEKIEGSFMTVNGIENDALKSFDKAGASKFLAFNNAGQFTLTTSPYSNGNATLPASEFAKRDEAGTYVLNDYSIELRFNNGTVIRRIFYFYLQGKTHFGVGNSVYVPKQSQSAAEVTSN
ncbi:hypothetical protein FAM09_04410 [Niastella caeni]|uniref:DUF3472 domain-containing protein n=1 Tax=Niastella caeni TaxID=2569763 RepID=A0A4S8I028_9BACT|nr:hypothetical protein [Niastella caeni]THU41357.1 hypothetical protein FAM09_04410 [Niastella caeni]